MTHSMQAGRTARELDAAAELDLDAATTDLLRARLSSVAEHTVTAIDEEVPSYRNALGGPMGSNIRTAVELALRGFLSLASRHRDSDAGTPLAPALEGAYALGRGEARGGRSMDALLAAYRVGARVAWRDLSTTAVQAGVSAGTLGKFAELVFAYIDELSAASVAGHADELATTGRVRQRYLQRLGQSLLRGVATDELAASARRADWEPPRTLTAVVLPSSHERGVRGSLDERTLRPEDDLPDLVGQLEQDESEIAVLLVPDAEGTARPVLLRTLEGHHACVGPARPWTDARTSYLRALRARRLGLSPSTGDVLDTDRHLAELVLGADPVALADLRSQVLAPLEGLRTGTSDRLAETLQAWLLHQGRREEVAEALHVHPQTVRYRMGQVRELYGDRLTDPATVLALTLALAGPGSGSPGPAAREPTPASG